MSVSLYRVLEKTWSFLISLKLAVAVIAGLAVTLAVATIIESLHDFKTAQFYVYRASWFYALLTLLGLNILAVALSRLPWKRKHFPFLMAHAGILMILVGSWLTYIKGVDGNLRVGEGEVNSEVELDQHLLVFKRGESVSTADFPWIPKGAAEHFKEKIFPEFGIKVEQFISDAEPKIQFIPPKVPGTGAPAIQVKIIGAPMGGAPEFWLWAGDPAWSSQKLGPARFLIRKEARKDLAPTSTETEARFDFIVTEKGNLKYETTSIRGEKGFGEVNLYDLGPGKEKLILDPKWKMPIRIQLKAFVFDAINLTEYVPVKVKASGMGTPIPQPAILVSLLDNPSSKLWLGIGDRADFRTPAGESVSIGYYPRRLVLPYGIRLKEFQLKHNPGTMDPAAYSSFVQVVDQLQKSESDLNQLPVTHITMNEPMERTGYTFYQASYIPDQPRPTVTILSVNYDPGRELKYFGSLLLILGSISLYLVKVFQNRKKGKAPQHA